MSVPIPLQIAALPKINFVGGTFLLSTLAMFVAAAFFFFQRSQVSARWRPSLLVAALVTLIAGTNYTFMSTLWIRSGVTPGELRYVDWLLTVPLICLQFYLLLDAAGAQPSRGMIWRLVTAAVWMLAFGYVGQRVDPEQSVLWGALSTLGYAAILFEISLGEANRLSVTDADERVKHTYDLLFRFIFIGWAIYPIGYMIRPGNLLAALRPAIAVSAMYNLGDVVNKIGFGLAVWRLAKSRSAEPGPSGPVTKPAV